MKKFCIALPLTLLLLLTASAETATPVAAPVLDESGLFMYAVLMNGTAEINDCLGTMIWVEAPDMLDGHRVTGLAENCFAG